MKIKNWFNAKRAEKAKRDRLNRLIMEKNHFVRILDNLPEVYQTVEALPKDKVLFLQWHGHNIPVDAEYLTDIIVYSSGVCRCMIKAYDDTINDSKD